MGSTGGGDSLGKMAKNCVKMTKSAFLGQKFFGGGGGGGGGGGSSQSPNIDLHWVGLTF